MVESKAEAVSHCRSRSVSPGLTVMNMRDEVTVDFNGKVTWYPLANMRSLCEQLGSGNKSEVQCSLR